MSDDLTRNSTAPPTNLNATQGTAGPLHVAPDCWMVGHRNPSSLLQCNTYLRVLNAGGTPRRVCIDPGSVMDFPVIEQNVRQLIGGLSEVDLFTLNHQDPDVVGNAAALCISNPRVQLLVTEETWRLAQHLNFRPGQVAFTGNLRVQKMRLGNQREWQSVPTPFCHFRGAVAFYDPEIRTLFTGDLFGGLNQISRVHLFAEADDWQGIALFHQIYMPSRDVLRYAVRQIRALQPVVETIAPQHGHVITGDLVPAFLDKMEQLLVGHDLLMLELDEQYQQGYQQVLNDVLAWAKDVLGETEALDRLRSSAVEDGLDRMLRVVGTDVELSRQGYSAVALVFVRLSHGEATAFNNALRSQIIAACAQRELPLPPISLGTESLAAIENSPAN